MAHPLSARDLAQISLGASLLAVSAWLTVPAAVPFTMQTFALCLVPALLGRRRGTLCFLLYLLLGVLGLPVFAGFRSGASVLLGPTGGYLLGFLPMVLLIGQASERFAGETWALAAAFFLGMLACYACGTVWFVIVYSRSSEAIGVGQALALCVLPFLLPDACKGALALMIARRLRPILNKMR